MKQSLQLKQGLQLNLTPQLQQAIRLLQLSSLELEKEIQDMIDSNPLLEHLDSADTMDDAPPEPVATDDDSWYDDIPIELSTDSQWQDSFPDSGHSGSASDDDLHAIDRRNSHEESLQEHLRFQVDLLHLVPSDEIIALTIIDSLNEQGFLSIKPELLFEQTSTQLAIDFEEFEAVRHLLQSLDPVGSASMDLQDCLLAQLKLLPKNTPFAGDAMVLVERHLNLLAIRDYAQLKRRTRFKEQRLKQAIELIQGLSPIPAQAFGQDDTTYITPDVIVHKKDGHWLVELSEKNAIKVGVNQHYASLIKRGDNSQDNSYLRDNLQQARWFIKSLESRNDTLLKVAGKIVEHQRGFLEYGEQAMKPLVLQDIASAINMHESTVSRATTQKYLHTPRGIFELKYFFSSHLSTDSGGECSSTAIRAMIKELVQAENSQKPLSDNKLVQLLEQQGVNIARRTVAKYREAMAIPPSNERKQLA